MGRHGSRIWRGRTRATRRSKRKKTYYEQLRKIDKIEDENDKSFAFAVVGRKSAELICIGMGIFDSGDYV